jgi:uncharacterized membrane protein
VCWGAYSLMLKKAAGQMPWQLSMALFVAGYALLTGGYYLVDRGPCAAVFEKKALWPLLAGILCGLGGIAFFRALVQTPGSVFLPLVSLSMIISGVGCLIVFKEPFTLRLALGILLGGIAVILLAK